MRPRVDRKLPRRSVEAFREKIYDYYERWGRNLPWRKNITAYRVLVSEIMLQQTQVDRVREKYGQFLAEFPNFPSLAAAPLRKLLSVWSGMGYNRRALALQSLARQVIAQHGGRLPRDEQALLRLPGIGKYTAGAVMAFAFNRPVVFMDTNIRRVYIHEFLKDKTDIPDAQLIPFVEQTLDVENPRRWYNALMDYGSMLKQGQLNPNRRSAHYARQGAFENSNRQLRGKILKALLGSPMSAAVIIRETGARDVRVKNCLAELEREGFIRKNGTDYRI